MEYDLNSIVRGTEGNEFGIENIGEVFATANNENTLLIQTTNESGTTDVVTRSPDQVYSAFVV